MYDYTELDKLADRLKNDLTTYQKYDFNYNSGTMPLPSRISDHYYCMTNASPSA